MRQHIMSVLPYETEQCCYSIHQCALAILVGCVLSALQGFSLMPFRGHPNQMDLRGTFGAVRTGKGGGSQQAVGFSFVSLFALKRKTIEEKQHKHTNHII